VRLPQEASQPPLAAATHVAAAHIVAAAAASPEQPSAALSAAASADAVVDLQSQLRDTQSSLTPHPDKVRALEGVLAEQEAMKRDVGALREMMDRAPKPKQPIWFTNIRTQLSRKSQDEGLIRKKMTGVVEK
jgi:hypothetical protein